MFVQLQESLGELVQSGLVQEQDRQVVVAKRTRLWAGGRPPKAVGASKARYTSVGAQEKLALVLELEDRLKVPRD